MGDHGYSPLSLAVTRAETVAASPSAYIRPSSSLPLWTRRGSPRPTRTSSVAAPTQPFRARAEYWDQMLGSQLPDGPRAARMGELVRRLWEQQPTPDYDAYTAIAVLIADAALRSDAVALRIGQNGLQRVHARLLSGADPSEAQVENRGRSRALIEVATWALRRVSAERSSEEPGSDEPLLWAIAERPGATVQELARALGRSPRDVAAAASLLSKAGLVVSYHLEPGAAWELSPRGRAYLRAA
jgi:hypothetical protein